jgi:hypothetical protein
MLNYTMDEILYNKEFTDIIYDGDLNEYHENEYYDQEIATWNTIEED